MTYKPACRFGVKPVFGTDDSGLQCSAFFRDICVLPKRFRSDQVPVTGQVIHEEDIG